jgi:hypothetical protein
MRVWVRLGLVFILFALVILKAFSKSAWTRADLVVVTIAEAVAAVGLLTKWRRYSAATILAGSVAAALLTLLGYWRNGRCGCIGDLELSFFPRCILISMLGMMAGILASERPLSEMPASLRK